MQRSLYFGARYYDPEIARFTTSDPYEGDANVPPSLNKYLYAYANPFRYVDLEGYDSLLWPELKRAAEAFIQTLRQAPGLAGNALRRGGKELYESRKKLADDLNKAVAQAHQIPNQIADKADPRTVGGRVAATTAYTAGKLVTGSLLLPVTLASQVATHTADPKLSNVPVVGPTGTNIGESTAKFVLSPGLESGSEMVGAWSGGALLVLGTVQAARALEVPGTAQPPPQITTPHGVAKQSQDASALAARPAVEQGAPLYRMGTTGKSQAAEGQFWSMEHPSTPGYAGRYGVPPANVAKADFIEAGHLKPNAPFVTRPAPPVGTNPGGGIEVVVSEGDVMMDWFSITK